MRGVWLRLFILAFLVFLLHPSAAHAQATREGRLSITVVDQTGAVIPKASVTVVGVDEATKKKTWPPATTNDKGVAVFTGLIPGTYGVTGEFPGFDNGLLRDLKIKSGDNKHALVLTVQGFAAEITVGRDAQTTASDRASTFGTALTREQVESLSEDPDEMRRQLQDLAGPNAAIRVDSFEGQELPPKSQIKAVHITRDAFAAENHTAGGLFIDIITQPGIGPMRGGVRLGLYDSVLDGRNPLIQKKGPAQNRNYGVNIGGSLLKNRSSFSLSLNGSSGYTTPNLYAATLSGRQAENLNLRTHTDYTSVYGLVDYALTKDQTLRVSFNGYGWNSDNQGVGAYDLAERAYSTSTKSYGLRVQEAGPLGRRFFINTRLAMNFIDMTSNSATDAPTVRVLDSFTSGGAQRSGGSHRRTVSLMSDLDYVRGIHSVRAGIQLDGTRYRTDDASNYLGTYTFTSLAAYEAGRPATFTRRIGDPHIAYWNLTGGVYLQDDIRISKTLTMSPGVRVEAQTHLDDYVNVGPRFGITWSPWKSGKTTLRGSWGMFYDWLSTGTYEQTLRVDGLRQQELNIVDPTYPTAGIGGIIPPSNRYLLGNDLQMARNTRVSAGLTQQVGKPMRLTLTYADVHGHGVLVGQNLNAPVNGVRPDAAAANVIEAVSLGRSRTRSLSTGMVFDLSGTAYRFTVGSGPAQAKGRRFEWKRGLTVMTSYTLAKSQDNTNGAFSVSPTGLLDGEWGPSSNDVRHRVEVGMNSGALKNFTVYLSLSGTSGSPYTITTGTDDNGDSLFNDRPAGIGRNTERTAWSWDSYGSFNYTLGFGKRRTPLPPGITISMNGGALSVGQAAAPQEQPRYRLTFSLYAQNLLNHANYVGYSGVMTSQFFRQPVAVSGVRTVRLFANLSF